MSRTLHVPATALALAALLAAPLASALGEEAIESGDRAFALRHQAPRAGDDARACATAPDSACEKAAESWLERALHALDPLVNAGKRLAAGDAGGETARDESAARERGERTQSAWMRWLDTQIADTMTFLFGE